MQSLIVATLLIASVLPDSFPADAAPALTPIPSDRYLHSTSALTDANPNQVIEIHFALSPSDPAQYEVALQASSHPGSTPLTPSEAIDRFRPDTSALTSYLKSFGVNPQPQFSTALDLDFVGSISQIGRALHVHFKSIGAPGQWVTSDQPFLPSATAHNVRDVVGLNGTPVFLPMATSIRSPQSEATNGASPATISCGSAYTDNNALTVANIEGQYAISQTSPGILTTYPQYEGSGYIGLVSFSAPADDFNDGPTFWNRESVPTPWPNVLHDAFIQNDGTVENNCDFLGEESIDEEWSGAVAPRATYLLVTSSGNSENGMLDQLADFYNNFKNIRVISISYGWQESQVSNTFELSLQTDLGDLQNDGQSVFSATGECSSACPGGSLPPVGVPAGEPSAIAVGGTVLAPNVLNWEYG